MNRLRFGALLMMRDGCVGFYLSHRVVLTVPHPGIIRATSLTDLLPAKVFTIHGVALPFFNAMTLAAECTATFQTSFDMLKTMLTLPEKLQQQDLVQYMRQHYGADAEDFIVPIPQQDTDNPGDNAMDKADAITTFNCKYEEIRDKIGKRPNILVCGYTGSGKSSLAKAILGDVVPDDAIGDGRPKTMGYDCYENSLVRIWDSKGLENGEAEQEFTAHTRDFVRQCQNDNNVDNHIHLVWYTIQGSGVRVTDCDLNLIRNIFNPQHVIIVITKADATRPRQKDALVESIAAAGIPLNHIIFTSDAESGAMGCKELMHLSYSMLPEAYRDAFMEAQRIDQAARLHNVKEKTDRAQAIIAAAVTAATASGAIPIPIADAAILVPIQVTMIASLAGIYGLKQDDIKQTALPFVAKMIGVFAPSSILKLVPGLGSVVNATVAGTLTAAMGMFIRTKFEEAAIANLTGHPAPEVFFDVELFKKFYADYKKQQ